MLHLCGLLIAGPVAHSHALWRNPRERTDFLSVQYYTSIAKTLERGKFDFVFFADRLGVADRYGNSLEAGIRFGDQDATRMDPVPILGAMAAVTSRLGLGATRSTTYDQPFSLAREFATLDHLSGGRSAWNVVTSMNDGEAMNYGMAAHLDHAQRYEKADEFISLAFDLWESWEKDALVLDKKAGIYADPDKVHYVNHDGTWFKSRGPLNIPRPPQDKPVIIQAGSSGTGKRFAAKWADVIFTVQPTPELMKRFTDDAKSELATYERAPGDCKVMAAVMPFVGTSRSEAEEKRDMHNALVSPLVGLSTLSSHANHDFAQYDMTAPLEEIKSRGTEGMLAAITRIAKEQQSTLADVGMIYGRSVMVPQIAGTAQDVADWLHDAYERKAADGFVISPAFVPDTFDDFVDGVVPLLQERGVFRRDYESASLRQNLSTKASSGNRK